MASGNENGLMRIFWPLDFPRISEPGVLVGWRNSEHDVFVVDVLNGVDVGLPVFLAAGAVVLVVVTMVLIKLSKQSKRIGRDLASTNLYRKSPHSAARLFELCGQSALHVLGNVNEPAASAQTFDPSHIYAYTQKSSRYPRIHCPPSSGIAIQVILFERPHPHRMQYLSLRPISLALEDRAEDMEGEADETGERLRREELVQKLRLHSVKRPQPTEKERSLQMIVDQVNCSHEMRVLLKENISLLVGRRNRRALSVSERVVEGATGLWRGFLDALMRAVWVMWPLVTNCFVVLIVVWRLVAETILKVLEWRLRPELAALKDISATGEIFPG